MTNNFAALVAEQYYANWGVSQSQILDAIKAEQEVVQNAIALLTRRETNVGLVRRGLELLGRAWVRSAMWSCEPEHYAVGRGDDKYCFLACVDMHGDGSRSANRADTEGRLIRLLRDEGRVWRNADGDAIREIVHAYDKFEFDEATGEIVPVLRGLALVWLAETGEAVEPVRLVSASARAEVETVEERIARRNALLCGDGSGEAHDRWH